MFCVQLLGTFGRPVTWYLDPIRARELVQELEKDDNFVRVYDGNDKLIYETEAGTWKM